jgi:hypothetical protein
LIERLQVLNLCELKCRVSVTNGPTPESIAAPEVISHDTRYVAACQRAARSKLRSHGLSRHHNDGR